MPHDHDLEPYPDSPGDSLKLVADKLRGGDHPPAELIHAGWHAIGYAAGQAFPDGHPPVVGAAPMTCTPLSDAELARHLEECCNARPDTKTGAGAKAAGAVPWLQIFMSLLPLLQQWIQQAAAK